MVPADAAFAAEAAAADRGICREQRLRASAVRGCCVEVCPMAPTSEAAAAAADDEEGDEHDDASYRGIMYDKGGTLSGTSSRSGDQRTLR